MLIRSTPSLHYPITVAKLLAEPDSSVDRFAPLFSYTFTSTVTEGDKYGDEKQVQKTWPAEFQSEIEGTKLKWKIKEGDVLERSGIPLVDIEEPCAHEIQFGGLCTNCGADMTEVDFITTQRNVDRATITTSHENTALRVSRDEAARASEEAKQRLLDSRKLSLVVDLDQTIIHATVDKTVAHWQNDPSNPNHDAVKNVLSFDLIDEGPSRSASSYYIKLRPGLEEFLERVSEIYELHIYTMGTRAYAQNIAKLVDPQQRFFGDRILSRDESGSLTVKSLQRLFPVDTHMVVIIDDRGDVWQWSKNLIKVIPYDFFVGIGDINSSFLPKRADLVSQRAPPPPPMFALEVVPDAEADGGKVDTAEEIETVENGVIPDEILPTAASDLLVAALAGDNDPSVLEEQSKAQAEVIATQVEEQPLAKKQEILDKLDEEEATKSQNGDAGSEPASEHEPKHRHSLLHDDDDELLFLRQHLETVHRSFFDEYDEKLTSAAAVDRVSQLRAESKSPKKPRPPPEDLLVVPDVKEIMPLLKSRVLQGVVILFTGVIPQGVNHESSDIGRWATSFGARISQNLSKSTTHVVAHKDRRTSKVRQAARHPSIRIVTISWLLQCFTRWTHADETPHLIEVESDHGTQDSLPFDTENGFVLTPDEDEDGPMNGLLEDGQDVHIEPVSPTLGDGDWDEVNAQLEAFMDSSDSEDGTDADTDREGDGGESDASTRSNASGRSTSSRSRKRKRATESAEGSGAEDSDDATNGTLGSNLQKRKKRALERTTGLANVATADNPSGLPSPDTTGPEEDEMNANGDAEDNDEDDFEKAMMAEFALEEDEGVEA